MSKHQKMAQGLASLGRGKDKMLVHMDPGEVDALHGLASLTGGKLTVNPHTGLYEAGWLSSILPLVAGGVATVMTGGVAAPVLAGMAAGALGAKAENEDPLMGGVMGAMGGWGGSGLASGLMGAGKQAAAQTAANAAKTAGDASLAATNATSAAAPGVSGMTSPAAAAFDATPQITAQQVAQVPAGFTSPAGADAFKAGVEALKAKPMETLKTMWGGAGGLPQAGSETPLTLAKGMTTGQKTGVGGTALQGLASIDASGGGGGGKKGKKPYYYHTSAEIDPNGYTTYGPGYWSKDYNYETLGQNPKDGEKYAEKYADGGPVGGKGGASGGQPMAAMQRPSQPMMGMGGMGGMAGGGASPAQSIMQSAKQGGKGGGSGGQPSQAAQGMAEGGLLDRPLSPQNNPAAMQRFHEQFNNPPSQTPVNTQPVTDYMAKINAMATAPPPMPQNQQHPQETKNTPISAGIGAAGGTGLGLGANASGIAKLLKQKKKKKQQQQDMTNPDNYKYTYDQATGTFKKMGQGGQVFDDGGDVEMFSGGDVEGGAGGGPNGRYIQGPGDGVSDDIPAMIDGQEPAKLASGEFVIDAGTVSRLGNGSSDAGAEALYAMMDRIHQVKTEPGMDINPEQYMPA